MSRLQEFRAYRQRLNDRLLAAGTQTTQRFFNLDAAAYREGALDVPTKELLGLVASLVLRCDDCISYHVIQALEAGVGEEAITETFDIGLVVGGSIVIPHVRRARELLDELLQDGGARS